MCSKVPLSTSSNTFGQICGLLRSLSTNLSKMFCSVVSINADPSLALFNWFFWTFCDGIAVVPTGKNSRWGNTANKGTLAESQKDCRFSSLSTAHVAHLSKGRMMIFSLRKSSDSATSVISANDHLVLRNECPNGFKHVGKIEKLLLQHSYGDDARYSRHMLHIRLTSFMLLCLI